MTRAALIAAIRKVNVPGPHSVWMALLCYALFLVFLALAIFSDIRAARAMEHEEIVARLATGQAVPGYRRSGVKRRPAIHRTK